MLCHGVLFFFRHRACDFMLNLHVAMSLHNIFTYVGARETSVPAKTVSILLRSKGFQFLHITRASVLEERTSLHRDEAMPGEH